MSWNPDLRKNKHLKLIKQLTLNQYSMKVLCLELSFFVFFNSFINIRQQAETHYWAHLQSHRITEMNTLFHDIIIFWKGSVYTVFSTADTLRLTNIWCSCLQPQVCSPVRIDVSGLPCSPQWNPVSRLMFVVMWTGLCHSDVDDKKLKWILLESDRLTFWMCQTFH